MGNWEWVIGELCNIITFLYLNFTEIKQQQKFILKYPSWPFLFFLLTLCLPT